MMYHRRINFKKEYLYFDKDDLNDLLYDIQIKGVCWKYGHMDRQAHGLTGPWSFT